MSDPVLVARDVTVRYSGAAAVRGVDLTVSRGEAVALIGETGSGKTSFAHAVARLLPPEAEVGGEISVAGSDVLGIPATELRGMRGSSVGFIPQDAMAALNPTMRVGKQIAEVFEVHDEMSRSAARARAVECLEQVRIADPIEVARLFPHELSGGMRQRVMIAIALALRPPLVVADEPTTALDVSTQAEVIGLVDTLRGETGTSFLWITHDMGVVAEIADRLAVMYRGRIVETGPVIELFDRPAHPYTEALLRTLRDLRDGPPGERMFQIDGQPPGIEAHIEGCAFHPRCPQADERCGIEEPDAQHVGEHVVRCHHAQLVTTS